MPPCPQDREASGTPLDFTIVGGWEIGHAVFVADIKPDSIPINAGLRVGDQVSPAGKLAGKIIVFFCCCSDP